MTTKRDIERRLDDLEDEAGSDISTVTIRNVAVTSDGEVAGVTRITECGPDGSTSERYDPPRALEEYDDLDKEDVLP